ncbi:hypothetical protein ACPCG0_00320 [Propionibacteriaceae bacterium Y1923]|uniref:hypothetical protein n=1 Tax=Aestuariimicrobium sp. Y1814 TaxID=3418742 RepID=UPI003C1335CA
MARDDADFVDPGEDDFAEFVARTRDRTTQLAFALTGDTDTAADLAERAYAAVRARWARLDEAGARAELRDQLLKQAKGFRWQAEGLDTVADTGWPQVALSDQEVAQRAGATEPGASCSRPAPQPCPSPPSGPRCGGCWAAATMTSRPRPTCSPRPRAMPGSP